MRGEDRQGRDMGEVCNVEGFGQAEGMFRAPFLARVAVGAAVYAIEEARRLPSAAVQLPVTAVSHVVQTGMHVQQFVTDLAVRGDEVIEKLAGQPVENPSWATFEDDAVFAAHTEPPQIGRTTSGLPRRTRRIDDTDSRQRAQLLAETLAGLNSLDDGPRNGRTRPQAPARDFADIPEPTADEPATRRLEVVPDTQGSLPAIAERMNYPALTLAQLRGHLRTLQLPDLRELLAYEQRTRSRAPFVTMLTNRIATVEAQ